MKVFTKWNRILVLVVSLVCSFACMGGTGGSTAVVILDEGRTAGKFSSDLLGSNLQWTDNGDTLFSPEGRIRPEALDAVKALPPAGLRFPGGLLSSTYRWRQGIGPQPGRGDGRGFSGDSQKMVVGTNEYLELLSQTGRSGLITVNVAGSSDEAAAWVGYVRDAAPGAVPLWEVGNESYLNQDPSFMSAAAYVRKFKEFAAAMKAADPSAKVGAILEASLVGVVWAKVVVPEAETWNEAVLKGTAGVADFYTVHLYAPFDAHKGDDMATLRTVQAGPLALADNLRKVRGLVSKHAPGASLLVTEFNIGMSDPVTAWKYDISLAQAAYLSQMLALFSTSGVDGAYHWSLIGNHCFGQIISGDDPRPRPSAMLYKFLSSLVGGKAVETEVEAGVLSYKEIGNVVPGLSPTVVFAQGYAMGDSLIALVVNRRPDSPVEVTFRRADGGALAAATGMMLTGDGPFAQVDKAPDGVLVVDVPAGQGLTLPPCGVALVQLR